MPAGETSVTLYSGSVSSMESSTSDTRTQIQADPTPWCVRVSPPVSPRTSRSAAPGHVSAWPKLQVPPPLPPCPLAPPLLDPVALFDDDATELALSCDPPAPVTAPPAPPTPPSSSRTPVAHADSTPALTA